MPTMFLHVRCRQDDSHNLNVSFSSAQVFLPKSVTGTRQCLQEGCDNSILNDVNQAHRSCHGANEEHEFLRVTSIRNCSGDDRPSTRFLKVIYLPHKGLKRHRQRLQDVKVYHAVLEM